jgi:hypothetical protein
LEVPCQPRWHTKSLQAFASLGIHQDLPADKHPRAKQAEEWHIVGRVPVTAKPKNTWMHNVSQRDVTMLFRVFCKMKDPGVWLVPDWLLGLEKDVDDKEKDNAKA